MLNNKPFIVAEIGQAHDGSLGMVHSYIESLKNSGVDAVKFQTHIADAESSVYEPFRVEFSLQDKSRMDYWRRMEFTENQWVGIKNHCEELGLEFLSSPFSIEAVKLLEKIKVKRYKIGSGEVSNLLMLEKISNTKKPIILSSGLSNFDELDNTINFLKDKVQDLSLLQCTTKYPTMPEDWGLNIITEMINRYKIPVGYSDHSGNIFASLAAAALGAIIFEFHVVFDKRQFGPDSSSSIKIDQVKELCEGIHSIVNSLQNPINKSKSGDEFIIKKIFEKSLAVNKDLKKGHVIKFSDLESKKPAEKGIPASKFKNIIGKSINKNLNRWEFINYNDIKN